MDEVVDIIDETAQVIKQISKHEAHIHGWLHKIVIGYVRDGENWVLVRQTTDRQDAGQLVAPVGGHVQTGETELEALQREAEEEIGTRNITVYSRLGAARLQRQILGRDENHLFVVYEIKVDDAINLGPEADSLESFTAAELKAALASSPQDFGDAYYFVLEHFYDDYLPSSYQFRWRT